MMLAAPIGAHAAEPPTKSPADPREALWSDPNAIRSALAKGSGDPLLTGLLAAYELRDAAATSTLKSYLGKASGDHPAELAARAALGIVLLRGGTYKDAAAVLTEALATPGLPADRKEDLQQTLAIAAVLKDAAPQARGRFAAGSVPVTRDKAGLARVPVAINGKSGDLVFDTGANFSVLMESQAKALGVTIVGDTAGIGSVTQTSTPSKIGLAERLDIGGVPFTNVVFLVLPDASLTFAGGAYTIPGIIGYPVISQLERVRVGRDTAGAEQVRWQASAGPAGPRDLYVDGLTPNVYVRVADGPPALFALDTGANHSSLRPALLITQPDLANGATEKTERIGSAGGVVDVKTRQLPAVQIKVDEVAVRLKEVTVSDEADTDDQTIKGRLGQDVLGGGYIIDFPAGDFALIPPT
jgi:hypothetical protein